MEAYFTIIFLSKHGRRQQNTLLPFYYHECFPVGATQQMTGILFLPAHHEFTYRLFKCAYLTPLWITDIVNKE